MMFVTPAPWSQNLQHSRYGTPETYLRAADWLSGCADVADWGGGTGHFRLYLPPAVTYTVVDGTQQMPGQVLADLTRYYTPSDGILLRHVLDNTEDWRTVLRNALAAFRKRLVVVTYTPNAPITHRVKLKSGWPIWRFNPDELVAAMRPHTVQCEAVKTSHPETVYYVERACAS